MRKNMILTSLAMMAEMSAQSYPSSLDEPIIRKGRVPSYPKEPKPQKGQFHYWFRIDGTFLTEKQDERMRKEDCFFKCFSINDKNAIKKFNKFSSKNNI